MDIHHLNCGTMRPYGLFPFSTLPISNTGQLFRKGIGVLHCLLIDSGNGLVLVDTGYGLEDYANPTPFVRLFNRVIGLVGDPDETAVRQIQALGYDPRDVKHIFLTHMHLDHTGGVPDFPDAQVHVYKPEYQRAVVNRGFDSIVYIDQHWKNSPAWVPHSLESDTWHGLPCTSAVKINDLDIFFVPTTGHSIGHCMVVAHLPEDQWIVHAGDTYIYHGQIQPDGPCYPRYFRLFRPLFNLTRVIRSFFIYDETLQRLNRELEGKITMFCSHDPHEFSRLSGTTFAS